MRIIIQLSYFKKKEGKGENNQNGHFLLPPLLQRKGGSHHNLSSAQGLVLLPLGLESQVLNSWRGWGNVQINKDISTARKVKSYTKENYQSMYFLIIAVANP